MKKTPAELCTKVEQRILEFDSDNADKPPQSSLPVLATALAEGAEAEPEAALETIYEAEVIPAGPNQGTRYAIGAVAAALAILCVILLWIMR